MISVESVEDMRSPSAADSVRMFSARRANFFSEENQKDLRMFHLKN